MADRKQSPLATESAPWEDVQQPASPASTSIPDARDQRKRDEAGARSFPSSGRRKRSSGPLDPFDKVGFNANLPVVMRRLARIIAARRECDVQDVIVDGLMRVCEAEGIEVPMTREEYDQLVRDGKL